MGHPHHVPNSFRGHERFLPVLGIQLILLSLVLALVCMLGDLGGHALEFVMVAGLCFGFELDFDLLELEFSIDLTNQGVVL